MMGAVGLGALAPVVASGAAGKTWPITESAETPKICLGCKPDDAAMRKVKQIGVNHVLGGAGKIPWQEADIRGLMEKYRAAGLTLYNIMIGGFNNAIYARAGRDEAIDKVKQSIRAAGKAGLPVVEYNWYAHRAMEGYYEETGRAGAGWTAFDYDTHERSAAASGGRRAHAGRDVDQHHLLPEGGGAGGRRGRRAAGAASQRSARAAEPRVAADHGDGGGMEEADQHRGQPGERHHLRLRRHARDGRGPGGGVRLLCVAASASITCIIATCLCGNRTRDTPRCSSTRVRWTCSA